MAEKMNNVKPVQAARPAQNKGSAAKKVGLATVIVAIVVPLLLAARALTVSKNAKKNKKKVSKTYSRLLKKAKRLMR